MRESLVLDCSFVQWKISALMLPTSSAWAAHALTCECVYTHLVLVGCSVPLFFFIGHRGFRLRELSMTKATEEAGIEKIIELASSHGITRWMTNGHINTVYDCTLCIRWHSCWLSPLALRRGIIVWYAHRSIVRSIDAMKSVTLTMLSQFFNSAWKVNADEQCCLPASTFFVYHFCFFRYAAIDVAAAAFCPFYFCFFRLRVEVLSDHSLFLLHPPIRCVYRFCSESLSAWRHKFVHSS